MAKKEQEEAQQADTEAAPGGGKKKLILLILGALVLVGGAVGGTLMIVGGDKESVAQEDEVEPELVRDDPSYIVIDPPFTVNLDAEDAVGFLQISLQILTFHDEVAKELEKHGPLIRNNLIALFGQQKSIDLAVPVGKEKLQGEVLKTVQAVIDEYGSGGEVDNVFFTSFVMQ